VIDAVEMIAQTRASTWRIEYMIDDRDGRLVYYDINALSNFVADAPNVIGFDPFRGWSITWNCGQDSCGGGLTCAMLLAPVFGGWLRNVDDEHMAATWTMPNACPAQRTDRLRSYLVAELNLNTSRRRRPGSRCVVHAAALTP